MATKKEAFDAIKSADAKLDALEADLADDSDLYDPVPAESVPAGSNTPGKLPPSEA